MTAKLDISSQVDRSEITIGDRIHYEIKVVYPKAGRLELPSVLGNLGSFEVKDYKASEPKEAGDLKIQTWNFEISTFTVGDYTLPPQLIEYREGADTTASQFFTQPIAIKVKRTSPETVKDIADIAPLAPVEAPVPWLLYGLGGAGILLILLALWFFLRRKKPAAAEKPALPPVEEALEALAVLKGRGLIRQNRAREYCFALSEILRRYVSRRYGIDALESTTSEFLEKAAGLPITQAQKAWLEGFCEKTDLVKFADAPLLESEGDALLAAVDGFARQTRPREGEPAEAGSARANADSNQSAPQGGPKTASRAQAQARPGAAKPTAPPAPGAPRRPSPPSGPAPGGFVQGGHGHDDPSKGRKP